MALVESLRLRARPRCPAWRRAVHCSVRRGLRRLRAVAAGYAFLCAAACLSASLHASPAVDRAMKCQVQRVQLAACLCLRAASARPRAASARAMASRMLPERNAISSPLTRSTACWHQARCEQSSLLVRLSSVVHLQRAPSRLRDCPRMTPIRRTLQIRSALFSL